MENNVLLQNLNPEQLAGVTHEQGPLLIIAGAGTGKTSVVTRRIAWLIMEQQVKPDGILALTFTEKAAGEMEERVDRLLPYGYVDLWISTFHSFCERVLREYGLEIGLPNEFKLLNQTEQWMLVQKNLERFELDYYRPIGNPTKFIHALLKHFSRAKDELVYPEEYLRCAEELRLNQDSAESTGGALKKRRIMSHESGSMRNKLMIHDTSYMIRNDEEREGVDGSLEEVDAVKTMEVAKAYHTYQQLLLETGAFDFGDLIGYTHQLLSKRPAILKKYQKQFKHILVDEFQDTNFAQYEIVKMLAGEERNVVVVGDDDQAIYRFRGASMSNILLFQKDYPEAKRLLLTKNYRSGQVILDAAYAFIQLNNPNRLEAQFNGGESSSGVIARSASDEAISGVARDDGIASGDGSGQPSSLVMTEKGRLSKRLTSQVTDKGRVELLHYETEHDEARSIVQTIMQMGSGLGNWDSYAILVRSNAQASLFEKYCYEANIPYQFLASRGLYTKRSVLDVVNYLRLLDNYHESPAFWRVLTMPVWKFNHHDLVNASHIAKRKNYSLYQAIVHHGSELNWRQESLKERERLVGMIQKHSEEAKHLSVAKVAVSLLTDSGYLAWLSKGSDPASSLSERERMAFLAETSYLNQLFKKMKHFEESVSDPSVKAFIELMELEMESGEEGGLSQDAESGPETLKIMTIHGAKGLEFETVFIPQLVDKRFPSIARGEPIELPEALIRDILSKGDVHLEEERRLMYVAMTRAKQNLLLTYADDYGGVTKKKPSRFLYELGLLEKSESRKVHKVESQKFSLISSASQGEGKGGVDLLTTTHYPLPTRYSYTQIKAFATCPYQYRFGHILKIPTKGSGTFSFGQSLHVTLQKFFEKYVKGGQKEQQELFSSPSLSLRATPTATVAGSAAISFDAQNDIASSQSLPRNDRMKLPSLEELLRLLDESWLSDWYESAWQEEEQKKKAKDMLKAFYGDFAASPPQTVFLEKDFNLKIAAGRNVYTFKGKIDRIDDLSWNMEHGTWNKTPVELIDYKTGRTRDLDTQDKRQLLLYQLAAKEVFGLEPVKLTFHYLEENKKVSFLGSEEELSGLKQELADAVEAIKISDFRPTPSQMACKYCDFREICEYRIS